MERYGCGSIVVVDHDPASPAMFEDERARIKTALDPLVKLTSTYLEGFATRISGSG